MITAALITIVYLIGVAWSIYACATLDHPTGIRTRGDLLFAVLLSMFAPCFGPMITGYGIYCRSEKAITNWLNQEISWGKRRDRS